MKPCTGLTKWGSVHSKGYAPMRATQIDRMSANFLCRVSKGRFFNTHQRFCYSLLRQPDRWVRAIVKPVHQPIGAQQTIFGAYSSGSAGSAASSASSASSLSVRAMEITFASPFRRITRTPCVLLPRTEMLAISMRIIVPSSAMTKRSSLSETTLTSATLPVFSVML